MVTVWQPSASCALALVLLALGACASLPKGRYGVEHLRFEGVEHVDEEALRVCLATWERPKFTLGLAALREPTCNTPPFDNRRAARRLWAWPWTSYPLYDEAVFKLDLGRIERWYQARGYYGAHVADVRFAPLSAQESDQGCRGDDCELTITVSVVEGRPVLIRSLELEGLEQLAPALREDVEDALELEEGTPFDEALYDRARSRVAAALREAGHARAEVTGDVAIHRGLLVADVTLRIAPGPVCRIGEVEVRVPSDKVPIKPIRAAALLHPGQIYHESDLADAQRSIYALGAFTAVTVRGDLAGEGEVIPIIIEVEPRRESEVLLGGGIMSGTLSTGPQAEEWVSVPQWDVHLLASYENRNFFGNLRRFRIEDRPKLLFLSAFPRVPDNSPRFGNTLFAAFSQPGVFEPRTNVFVETRWDFGPDPFQLFFRHDFGIATGLDRGFFRQRLLARVALHEEVMAVSNYQPIVDDAPSSYRLSYLEQRLSLDLRDDSVEPTRGLFARVAVHEALRVWDPSWNYVRVTPDARVYAPLGLGLTLAARFAVGAIYIFSSSNELDEESKKLGPQIYRLRGGGAQSNRGFLPGQLGDSTTGGIRRWEASMELRIPLTRSFSVAAFTDFGDVSANTEFRFDHLNTSVGGGLRYRTLIGPLRLDVGYRPAKLQRADGSTPEENPKTDLAFARFPGAVQLTIGESF